MAIGTAIVVACGAACAQPSGVCARISTQLDQSVVISRSAFRGTLTINNGTEADYLTGVRVTVDIRDLNGGAANDLFQVRPPDLTGISDVDGNGQVAPMASASASYVIVPFNEAAPAAPTDYRIGGSLSYTVAGNNVSVDFVPVTVTVLPNPLLRVKYFLERDVIADDPFTPETEPSIPFSLGLMMSNTGAGEARNVEITSSVPRITENERDLLISFQLVGTMVGPADLTPSLLVTLGDIPPGQTRSARWLFTSTLQGRFRDYEAEYRHIDGLGNPRASLIESLDFLELAHVVRTDDPDDLIPDYMTYPEGSKARTPDFVHLSQGVVEPVSSVFDAAVIPNFPTSQATITVASAPDGWTYIRVPDPYNGSMHLESVMRADGKVIIPTYNAWQTNRIIRKKGEPPQPDRHIHIFDKAVPGAPVQYLATFRPDGTAPTASNWRSVRTHGAAGDAEVELSSRGNSTDPRAGGVRHLSVSFSEPILGSSFTPSNVAAIGVAVPSGMPLQLSGSAITTALSDDRTTGHIRFSPPLPDSARYCVIVSGVTDDAGAPLEEQRTAFFSLPGDANADARIGTADEDAIVALLESGKADPIDPSNSLHVRADVNTDGRIDELDLDRVAGARRVDARVVPDVCASGEQPDGPVGDEPPSLPGSPIESRPTNWALTDVINLGEPKDEYYPDQTRNSRGFRAGSVTLPDGHTMAILVSPDGTTLEIGTLGGSFSVALGLNELNQIVGYSETASGEVHAFRYTPAAEPNPARMEDLGTLGGSTSWANSINDTGMSVGASTLDQQSGIHAFLHDGSSLVDLNWLLPPGEPWMLSEARTIDNEMRIRGVGALNGRRQAFDLGVRPDVGTGDDRCPADFNHDGAVNSSDFFEFMRAFLLEDNRADVNRDGLVNSEDIFEFLNSFFVGCQS